MNLNLPVHVPFTVSPPSLSILDLANAGSRLRGALVDRARQSVFGVFSNAAHTPESFLGCAWKLAPDVYITCYHVVSEGPQGPHGIFVPAPDQPFRGGVFFLKNGTTHARVRPLQRQFAARADLAVLLGRGGNTALPLAVSQRRLCNEGSVMAVGYSAADVERTGHGRVQNQLLEGRESLASLQCDNGMSGCPVIDDRCQVVGMVTGCLGQTQPKTRVLSHERVLVALDDLRQMHLVCL